MARSDTTPSPTSGTPPIPITNLRKAFAILNAQSPAQAATTTGPRVDLTADQAVARARTQRDVVATAPDAADV